MVKNVAEFRTPLASLRPVVHVGPCDVINIQAALIPTKSLCVLSSLCAKEGNKLSVITLSKLMCIDSWVGTNLWVFIKCLEFALCCVLSGK